MSLHNLAHHLQSAGRNGDTMLVHMTPGEVQGLQALAMAHGGSLTINPETGLPESFFLAALLPTIAGIGLKAAGLSAMQAALTVGAIGTVATGSLKQGIMAGFGAYGGANLGDALSAAGSAAAAGASSGASAAGAGATTAADIFKSLSPQQIQNLQAASAAGKPLSGSILAQTAAQTGTAAAQQEAIKELIAKTATGTGGGDLLRGVSNAVPDVTQKTAGLPSILQGVKNVTENPEDLYRFAKDNFYPLAAIASSISAGQEQPRRLPKRRVYDPIEIVEYGYDEPEGVPGGSTAERNYFPNTRFTPTGRTYAARGGLMSLANGGTVEDMSIRNAIGANTMYPMANQMSPAYSVPRERPISTDVVRPQGGGYTDPYTGEQKLADGGAIRDAYIKFLGREPDSAGLNHYSQSSISNAQMLSAIQNSPEAQIRTRLTGLYSSVLGRPDAATSDPVGFNWWVNEIMKDNVFSPAEETWWKQGAQKELDDRRLAQEQEAAAKQAAQEAAARAAQEAAARASQEAAARAAQEAAAQAARDAAARQAAADKAAADKAAADKAAADRAAQQTAIRNRVTQLYEETLRRPGDEAGITFWTNEFGKDGVITAAEEKAFKDAAAPEISIRSELSQLYADVLGRPDAATADKDAFEQWVRTINADRTFSQAERNAWMQGAQAELDARKKANTANTAIISTGTTNTANTGLIGGNLINAVSNAVSTATYSPFGNTTFRLASIPATTTSAQTTPATPSQVANIYERVLGRQADLPGLTYYSKTQPITPSNLEKIFENSPEFFENLTKPLVPQVSYDQYGLASIAGAPQYNPAQYGYPMNIPSLTGQRSNNAPDGSFQLYRFAEGGRTTSDERERDRRRIEVPFVPAAFTTLLPGRSTTPITPTIPGGGGIDTIPGGGGIDTTIGGGGIDTTIGGGGTDTISTDPNAYRYNLWDNSQRDRDLIKQFQSGTNPKTRADLVEFYVKDLGRIPDEAGFNFWLNKFGEELDPNERKELETAAQKEIDQRKGIEALYRQFGQRDYDIPGLEYWLGEAGRAGGVDPIRSRFETGMKKEIEMGNAGFRTGMYDVGQMGSRITPEESSQLYAEAPFKFGEDSTGAANRYARQQLLDLYQQRLGRRLPDPEGFNFWIREIGDDNFIDPQEEKRFLDEAKRKGDNVLMANGGMVGLLRKMAEGGNTSREARVRKVYQDILGRAADDPGLQYYTTGEGNKYTEAQLADMFGGSREGQIQKLYRDVLGRSADRGGMEYYLQGEGRALNPNQIAEGFRGSEEYKSRQNPVITGTAKGQRPLTRESLLEEAMLFGGNSYNALGAYGPNSINRRGYLTEKGRQQMINEIQPKMVADLIARGQTVGLSPDEIQQAVESGWQRGAESNRDFVIEERGAQANFVPTWFKIASALAGADMMGSQILNRGSSVVGAPAFNTPFTATELGKIGAAAVQGYKNPNRASATGIVNTVFPSPFGRLPDIDDVEIFNQGGQIPKRMAVGGLSNLGSYSDGGRLLKGPGDGVSDSIPAVIGNRQPARLADGEFVIPARIVSELGNGSTDAGARKLYAMMDRIQRARQKSVGKQKIAINSRAEKYLPA